MTQKYVLSLFDRTTNIVKPWARAGYTCLCVDIQHPKGQTCDEENIFKIGADLRRWYPPAYLEPEFVMAFPPCTHLAVSGARWMQEKGLDKLIEALELFNIAIKLTEWSDAPYFIENPVSTISTYWRKPDHIFQPWQYGDLWLKKTCLWTGNGFIMPDKLYTSKPEGVTDRLHNLPPSPERADLRSETPPKFAEAVFQANCRRS